jgi:predicted permease
MIDYVREAWQRVRSFFHKARLDSDLSAEVASHLEFAAEENLTRGMTPEEARRQALIRFGGITQAKEQQREARGLPWLDVLMQDLRFGLHTLRKDSGFTLIAVLMLALGIGANIVVFSVVNTILLRPLPFLDPQRLVWIEGPSHEGGLSDMTYSADAFRQYAERNHSLASVTAYMPFYGPADYKLTGRGEPQPVSGVMVAGNFFETLQVQPALGRLFTPEECRKGGRHAVLLSWFFWKRQFHGDPHIVGQAITLNNAPVTVAGVLPDTFDFGSVFAPGTRMDIFVPGIMEDMRHWGNTLLLIGRLAPGVTVAQAQAEGNLLFPHLYINVEHPEWNSIAHYEAKVQLLKDHVSGSLRRSLVVLWWAVGLILLIVCVNLSNLLLARAASRSKEFAMRAALGSGRARLVRQLLTESMVLSSAGAVVGLGLAFAITSYLAHQGSVALPLLSSVEVDSAALGWTLLIAVVAAMLFGLAPALRMAKGNLQEALKDSGHGSSDGRKHERMRAVLVVSEVALACVLLVGAGLLLRSFLKVMNVDLGFTPSHAAAIAVDYDDGNNASKRGALLEEVLRRVKAIPGIEAAGISDMLPLDRNRSWNLSIKGVDCGRQACPDAFVYIVTPGYLQAVGMRLKEGRDVSWSDKADGQKVAILNEAAAKLLWPGQDPLGRFVEAGPGEPRVIGIVENVRETGVEDASGPEVYFPTTQAGPAGAELVVRTTLPPDVLAATVMATLRSMNPGQPATEFRTIQSLVDHATSPRRFFALLVGIFAGLGLLLASLGIYGVISYSVTQQTKEIGIRMALGATTGRVQLGVIRRTMALAIAGIALGALLSLALARMITSLLFGTQPTDLLTFAAMAILLSLVAFVAGYLPARRASRIDPLVALRTN